MEEKIAIIGIFVHNVESAHLVNDALHKYSDKIIGRMGIPYSEKQISIISVIVRATSDEISALSGTLGRIKDVSVKSMQTSV